MPDGKGGVYKTGKPYKVAGRWYKPKALTGSYDETGVASWYGRDFHGKHTANGETYDMHSLSAAHKTLPLPTLVRVTNLDNGRSVVVRVNDRGPFVKERLIDLSYAAAKALAYDKQGTAHVRVQTLDIPPASTQPAQRSKNAHTPAPHRPSAAAATPAAAGQIFIQLGAFASAANAQHLQQQLHARFPAAHTVQLQRDGKQLYRVRIGPFNRMSNIESTINTLQHQGFQKTMVVVE